MKKHSLFSIILAVMMLFSMSGFSPVHAQTPASQPAANQSYIPGELVVGFNPNASPGDLSAQGDSVANSIGATVLKSGLGGMSLLKVPEGADVNALSASLEKLPGVKYVEPNFVVKLIDPAAGQTQNLLSSYVIRTSHGKDGKVQKLAYPISGLKSSKTKKGTTVTATYPNDKSVWTNWGWSWVGADVVWSNSTPSKNVCVVDTGVDYLHPDLAGKVIKGFDFVNYDLDPMDDYGHGTHVAGIIAAVANNKQGISGVSTGKIVAVKVMDSNGTGTSYDIAQGIIYCANRPDVNIINLSLGGPDDTTAEYNAVALAIDPTHNKLVVAAAGNDASIDPIYPAGYAQTWPDRVLAVAAAGKHYMDPVTNEQKLDQNCQATYSNFGEWVSFVAPGTDIYSTTPWDKPFTMITSDGVSPRYSTMSGTSMAAPFVSAAAARAWGYKPTLPNSGVRNLLYTTGWTLDTKLSDNCWDTTMSDARLVSVSKAMDRGAITLNGVDANTNLPLVGATVSLYQGTAVKAAIITAIPPTDPLNSSGVDMEFTSWADIINLPATNGLAPGYTPKISAANYTATAQKAFVDLDSADGTIYSWAGYWEPAWAVVPQKSANFTVVGEFIPAVETTFTGPSLVAWLPDSHPFVVNPNYYNPAFDPDGSLYNVGAMAGFPFARWLKSDWNYEVLTIRNRPGFPALPYYQGDYVFTMTDRIDDGDPGNMLDQGYASAFVWKDGVIKLRVDKGTNLCGGKHWWGPFDINSGASGSPTYNATPGACGLLPIYP